MGSQRKRRAKPHTDLTVASEIKLADNFPVRIGQGNKQTYIKRLREDLPGLTGNDRELGKTLLNEQTSDPGKTSRTMMMMMRSD